MNDADIAAKAKALLAKRAPSSSICPSEVARALSSDEPTWRALMPQVRRVAVTLMTDGRLRITRRGVDVAADDVDSGPIRLARGLRFDAAGSGDAKDSKT
jgi:glucose/arabinose dehydrogenase